MSLYRGAGGASDATDDSTVNAVAGYASSAASSAAAAASSALNAASNSISASMSDASAASSVSLAAGHASNASTSASNAANSASSAAISASQAATSATNANIFAGAASSSASDAISSANSAAASAATASAVVGSGNGIFNNTDLTIRNTTNLADTYNTIGFSSDFTPSLSVDTNESGRINFLNKSPNGTQQLGTSIQASAVTTNLFPALVYGKLKLHAYNISSGTIQDTSYLELFANSTSSLLGNAGLDLRSGSATSTSKSMSFYIDDGDSEAYRITSTGTSIWYPGFSEGMRLTESGNLLVGTTSASNRLAVVGSSSSAHIAQFRDNRSDGASGAGMIVFDRSGSTVGSISTTTSSTSYNTSSDYRLKHDITPMTGALAKVSALKPCTYKWNLDGSAGEGFIAHELAEVCPAAVTGEKDAVDAEGKPVYQGIDTSFLVATLTAAIQEQQAIINAQQAALNQLKARLDAANI